MGLNLRPTIPRPEKKSGVLQCSVAALRPWDVFVGALGRFCRGTFWLGRFCKDLAPYQ